MMSGISGHEEHDVSLLIYIYHVIIINIYYDRYFSTLRVQQSGVFRKISAGVLRYQNPKTLKNDFFLFLGIFT